VFVTFLSLAIVSNNWEKQVTNENYVQEETKSRLNFGRACYRSVQNFVLPSCLLVIKLHKTSVLSFVLYGGEY
jgi:transcription initiation factor IIE alpha subunit